MIGSVRGKVIFKDGDFLIVETGGIGYRVLVSEKIWSKSTKDNNVFLYIYTNVKEDALELFGFVEIEDLKLFESLISVSGVGPKIGLSILSFSSRQEVTNAVLKGDVGFFTKVPRLGKKNAQKIIIELKSKLKDTNSLDLSGEESEKNVEIYEALKTFGFSRKEIGEAIKNFPEDAGTTNDKIKIALKYLGK